MRQIEGIEFSPHSLGTGHGHAIVVCNDGAKLSIIQCDGTGEMCRSLAGWPTADRGCFYGSKDNEDAFEVLDYSHVNTSDTSSEQWSDGVQGWMTPLDVVRRIMEHEGIHHQEPVEGSKTVSLDPQVEVQG